MVKRTLIAIAVVALLATTANAFTEWTFTAGDHAAVKVDGKENPTIRWPYEINYTALDICTMPVKMHVGMYVRIIDCDKKKIILEQVPCSEVGKGDDKYPCYKDCEEFVAQANFPAEFGTKLAKNDAGDAIIGGWEAYYDGGNTIPGDGSENTLKVCVKSWEAKLYNHAPGEEITVGSLTITVKPQ